jgi:hypothetical protein
LPEQTGARERVFTVDQSGQNVHFGKHRDWAFMTAKLEKRNSAGQRCLLVLNRLLVAKIPSILFGKWIDESGLLKGIRGIYYFAEIPMVGRESLSDATGNDKSIQCADSIIQLRAAILNGGQFRRLDHLAWCDRD